MKSPPSNFVCKWRNAQDDGNQDFARLDRAAAFAPSRPSALLVLLDKCAIVFFRFAALDAFLMLRRAASCCFFVVITYYFPGRANRQQGLLGTTRSRSAGLAMCAFVSSTSLIRESVRILVRALSARARRAFFPSTRFFRCVIE